MKKKIIASILAAVTVLTGVFTAVACSSKDKEKETANVQTESSFNSVTDENGEVLDEEVNDMPTRMTFRNARMLTSSASEYDSVTIQATVKPDNATNKNVSWSVAFVNSASTWATGKVVTDYVTVTPQAAGSNVATVECLQPFGEQIKITVTSESNKSVKAECTLDFAKRIISAPLQMDARDYGDYHVVADFSDDALYLDVELNQMLWWDEPHPEYSDYTVDDEFVCTFELVSNAETVAQLSADTGLPVVASSLKEDESMDIIYDTLLSALGGLEWPNTANYNILNNWLMTNTDKSLFTIKYQAVGQYSTYEAEVPIYLNAEALSVLVTSIALDQSNVVI